MFSISVPEDLCLLGCVFFVTDYQRYLSPGQMSTWRRVIEQHGGQVDDSYSNRVTHLMCETQHSDVFVMVSAVCGREGVDGGARADWKRA